jgi:hypothetical protein
MIGQTWMKIIFENGDSVLISILIPLTMQMRSCAYGHGPFENHKLSLFLHITILKDSILDSYTATNFG